MSGYVEILELRGGMTIKKVERVTLDDEAEVAKFCGRFNKVNVPASKLEQASARYLYARAAENTRGGSITLDEPTPSLGEVYRTLSTGRIVTSTRG